MADKYLIVGLGNPGRAYEKTRHNIGFIAVEKFAHQHGWTFHQKLKFKGNVAEGKLGEASLVILTPLTFMNLSGEAVALAMRYLEIDLSRLLIVLDDVDLPLGQIRMRINSGAGTHNGLKSVEEQLQTNRYARLRIGVGDPVEGDLVDHVLGRFSEEEEKVLPQVLEKTVQAIEIWLDKGITRAMDFANVRPSNPSHGE